MKAEDVSDKLEATEPFLARADRLFEAALDLPAEKRAAYLDQACRGDGELRRLVERLIKSSESDDTWLAPGGGMDGPLGRGAFAELSGADSPAEGTEIGHYRIVREIGRGGMAVVYLAERSDGQFEQQVALKRIQSGAGSEESLQRFDRERQILAHAEHPNIARLIDGGVDAVGRPYFAMEYVEGQPIDRYCDRHRLTVTERLALFLQVARAVDYAHRNLVVHRDVKPSNILVTAEGHVKLLDFGIAKLLEPAPGPELTRSYAQLMTPMYASPEQIRSEPVTTASDVYQLGVLLYLLLTGRWPYRLGEGNAGEVVRAICHAPPTRPSTAVDEADFKPTGSGDAPGTPETISEVRRSTPAQLRRRLQGDLDNIVLMALRKEPERRYGSVAQMIADVECFLANRPVSARPDTFLYRFGKLVRRHQAAFATAVLAALLLISLATFYTLRLADERDRARQSAAEANQVSDFLRSLFEVSAPTRSQGELVTARQLLDQGADRIEQLADQPHLQAAMMTLMGDVFGELALYREARPLLERAVALRRERPPADPRELAESLHGLARVLEKEGEHDRAQALYEEMLAIHERVAAGRAGGSEAPEVAAALNGLGRTLALKGDFEAAREHHERALGILEESFGAHHPAVGRTLRSLGIVAARTRDFDRARGLLERAIAILEDRLESDHPYVADARVYLGDALRFTGDTGGARAQYEQALPLLERVYGPDHPEVALALNKLGNLLNAVDRPDAAIETHRRALRIRETAFGSDHHLVASSLNNIGLAHWRKQELATAQEYFERSAAVWEAALGAEHVDVAIALLNLAQVLVDRGQLEAAVPLFERVLAIRQQAYGPEHSLLTSPLYQLGKLRLRMKAPETAEPLLRRALALGRDSGPRRTAEIIWPRIFLGRCLTELGRYSEAEELLLLNADDQTIDPEAAVGTRQALTALYEVWGRSQG